MTIKELLAAVYMQPESLRFDEVIAAIESGFEFRPTAFVVGTQQNANDENQNSCKVLSFAHSAGLSQQQTLSLFAEHYRAVIDDPDGRSHQNIRQFMQHGWHKVSFAGKALTPRR